MSVMRRLEFKSRRFLGQKTKLAILGLAVASASFVVFDHFGVRSLAQSQIDVKPFVLRIDSYSFDQNPAGELLTRKTVARRSDGATVRIGTALGRTGLHAGETYRKIIFPDGTMMTVFDSISAQSTAPPLAPLVLARWKERLVRPPDNCVFPGETLVGHGEIAGLKVAIVKWPPNGDLEDLTQWRAPELACEGLQLRVEAIQGDGTRGLRTEARLVSLELREPDQGLFEAGRNYAEMAPSEAFRRVTTRLGIPWSEEFQRAAEKEDRIYFSRSSVP